jgi:hypothetical protein
MTTTTATATPANHIRDEHYGLTNPNTWTQAERMTARDNCALCRLVFRPDGEFRAAGNRPEALEFSTGNYSHAARLVSTGSDNDDLMRSARPSRPAARRDITPATEKQVEWINKKFGEVEHSFSEADKAAALANKALASKMLDVLFAAPRKVAPVAPTTAPIVPDGRYALRTDDHVAFYLVESPTQGKWAGYTFVSQQASDDLYPMRNRAQKEGILARIAEDVKGALALYGHELGRCGVCNRTLTDDLSRERGIGPVCYDKF